MAEKDKNETPNSTYGSVLGSLTENSAEVSGIGPDLDFIGFSTYTMLLPYWIEKAKSMPQSDMHGKLWNWMDSFYSFVLGMTQLATADTNHRKEVTQVKGLTNIASGLQLATLTIINYAAYGGFGFAAGVGVSFMHSLDDTIRFGRRYYDTQYWINDSTDQCAKLKEERQALQKDITDNKHDSETLKLKEARLKKIDAEIKTLGKKIAYVTKYAENNNGELPPEIKKEALKEFLAASMNSCMLGLQFVGMLLFCFPGNQLPVMLFITISAALCLIKYTCGDFVFTEMAAMCLKEPKKEASKKDLPPDTSAPISSSSASFHAPPKSSALPEADPDVDRGETSAGPAVDEPAHL